MYVVLSRVKTLKGLYLRQQLDKKDLAKFNDIPRKLKELINLLRQNKLKTAFSNQDYEKIFEEDFDKLVAKRPTLNKYLDKQYTSLPLGTLKFYNLFYSKTTHIFLV